MELEILIDIYKEQILALEAAGADLLVVETMMSLGGSAGGSDCRKGGLLPARHDNDDL